MKRNKKRILKSRSTPKAFTFCTCLVHKFKKKKKKYFETLKYRNPPKPPSLLHRNKCFDDLGKLRYFKINRRKNQALTIYSSLKRNFKLK